MRKPVLDWRPDKPTGVYAYPADSYWLSVLPYSDEWRWIVARPRGTMDGWSPTLEAAQVAAEDALRKRLADLVPVMRKLGMLESSLPICTECAKREGLVWPKDKPVTDAEGICSVCGEQRGVSPRREWE